MAGTIEFTSLKAPFCVEKTLIKMDLLFYLPKGSEIYLLYLFEKHLKKHQMRLLLYLPVT